MKPTVRGLQGEDIVARDGPIGAVQDVYFDDERWAVRYLVVDTGSWLPGRRVLVSPAAIERGAAKDEAVHVRLTREQVQQAPHVDTARPVSRQQEIAHAAHFGYPYYWNGPLLWGASAAPIHPLARDAGMSPSPEDGRAAARAQAEAGGDAHLRSGAEVIGYDIEARDGALGKLRDFVLDEATWSIRGVVVDTKKWWPGGEVRIAPEDVEAIDWGARTMRVRLTREELKRAAAA